MIAHLAPGLSLGERHALLLAEVARLGWSISRWPRWLLRLGWSRQRSAAVPIGVPWLLRGRTVYLAETAVEKRGLLVATERTVALLAHELRHAQRQEDDGRAKWIALYTGGPVLVVLAMLAAIGGGVAQALGCPLGWAAPVALVALAVACWGPSERWRRSEEVEAEAHETAARAAARRCDVEAALLTVDRLHSHQWPYLVGGTLLEVQSAVLARARAILSTARGGD